MMHYIIAPKEFLRLRCHPIISTHPIFGYVDSLYCFLLNLNELQKQISYFSGEKNVAAQ